jgi:hypothetical protein
MEREYKIDGPATEYVSLHNSLRIKQKLGHVSTNRTMQEYLFPPVIRMGGKKYIRTELLSELLTLTTKVTQEQKIPFSESFLYQYVARIVEIIVDCNEEEKQKLLEQLQFMAEQRATELSQEIFSGVLPKKNKMPRKKKKQIKKSASLSLLASRQAAELDAHGRQRKV